jgi:glycosyltransferase involved in cell wall biosynthesis
MTGPLVSVVLPVKNGARFIGEALASVAAQDYRPLEVIVIDAASSDGTRDIVTALASHGVRLVDQTGLGIATAWNQGLDESRGEFIAFISSDDRWLPGKLARQIAAMQVEPALMYTVTNFRYFVQPNCDIPATFNRALLGRPLIGRIMETLVARRGAFEAVGRFDAGLRTAEDVDWYARAKDADVPMRVLDDVLLEKRVHDDNLSASGGQNTPHLVEALRRSIQRRRDGRA